MAELTESKIYSAFGLEPPKAANGAQVQGVAAPAAGSETAGSEPAAAGNGAQVQELADPDNSPAMPGGGADPEGSAPSAEDMDAGNGNEPGKPLTVEQRRQNAQRRREEEQRRHQQAIDSAVQQALSQERQRQDAAMADFFAKAGMKNTITGETITSMAQFQDWQNQFAMSKVERNLKEGKLTPEDMQQLISQNPVVQQAQQVIEQNRQAMQQQEQARERARIDADIAEVSQLAESYNLGFAVESVEDLVKMPNSKEFYERVKQGKSIPEAFKLVFFDQMMEGRARAAQQSAMVNARGKDHLTGTSAARGSGAMSVPSSEMQMYRLFNPGATEAQIQAHFNRYKKNN